ncbi:MAG: hypothetical protein LH606_15070, partial [Cytophagaceae bacterium]|nr:hypothetical protein [Cytophagaceae bacterium]
MLSESTVTSISSYLQGERLRQFSLPEKSTPLSAVEQSRFEICELIIARGLQTFVDVGQALFEIRRFRLYRTDFPTFELYCKD